MEKSITQDHEVTNCTGWMKVFSVKDGYLHVQMVRFWHMRMKQIRQMYLTKSYGRILCFQVVKVIVLISAMMLTSQSRTWKHVHLLRFRVLLRPEVRQHLQQICLRLCLQLDLQDHRLLILVFYPLLALPNYQQHQYLLRVLLSCPVLHLQLYQLEQHPSQQNILHTLLQNLPLGIQLNTVNA
jgi:hypothetical protein